MKAVIKSVSPRICEKVTHGDCTILLSKTAPQCGVPFKCYIYCTQGKPTVCLLGVADMFAVTKQNGKVIGEFVCDNVEKFSVGSLRCDDIVKLACLSYKEIIDYFYKENELDGRTSKLGYAWHISDLKIYDLPKDLSEFRKPLKSVYCNRWKQYGCDEGCVGFDGTDFYCRDYWNWTDGITRPPQSWRYALVKNDK